MSKTVTYLTLSALSMSCALASDQGEMFQSGIYSGMNLGASMGYMNVKQSIGFKDVPFFAGLRDTVDHLNASTINFGGVADAFVGYRRFLNPLYMVGAEAALTYDSTKMQTSAQKRLTDDIFSKHSLSRKITFTPQFVAGYVFAPRWLGYVKVGPSLTRFSYTIHNRTPDQTLIGTQRLSKITVGASLAAGAEYALNSEWSLTGSLSYTYYPSVKFKPRVPSSLDPAITQSFHTVKMTSSVTALKMGFVYRY